MLNNVSCELSPDQRHSAGLPLIPSEHLQMTALILSKVNINSVVEVLLMGAD